MFIIIIIIILRPVPGNHVIMLSYVPFHCSDAHRALELLEDYHTRLTKSQDKPLKTAIERVIRIFKSRLFQALLGKLLR